MRPPLIGITCDIQPHPRTGRLIASAAVAYADCVAKAGGTPVLLAPDPELISRYLNACDGFVFTGGDDPDTREFGQPVHAKATLMNPTRQRFEVGLLRELEKAPDHPVLGVCLGMQLMSLVAGGHMDQHMPDTLPTHADHYSKDHAVRLVIENVSGGGPTPRIDLRPASASALVASHHRQAITDPGRLRIIARAHDGVIEAVDDPKRKFWIGVQWHPERTWDDTLGPGVFRSLVAACGR